jgi:hypothetical protein
MECTMQNLADALTTTSDAPLLPSEAARRGAEDGSGEDGRNNAAGVLAPAAPGGGLAERLNTFLVYNMRRKVRRHAARARLGGTEALRACPPASRRFCGRPPLGLPLALLSRRMRPCSPHGPRPAHRPEAPAERLTRRPRPRAHPDDAGDVVRQEAPGAGLHTHPPDARRLLLRPHAQRLAGAAALRHALRA